MIVMDGNLLVALIVLGLFYFLYKLVEVIVHRRERLMFIEKLSRNEIPCDVEGGPLRLEFMGNAYGVLRPCGFAIGLGIGLLVSYLIFPGSGMFEFRTGGTGVLTLSLLCVFSGIGMLGAFFMERYMRRRDAVSRDRKAQR